MDVNHPLETKMNVCIKHQSYTFVLSTVLYPEIEAVNNLIPLGKDLLSIGRDKHMKNYNTSGRVYEKC